MENEFLDPGQEVPGEMRVLKRWAEEHRSKAPFSGVTALFIQHQLGNQLPFTQALIDLGLDPKCIFWLDVPYTSNPRMREELVGKGIPGKNLIVHEFRVLQAYTPYQRLRTQELIRGFLLNPPERLLVLDDGAYFLEAASCFRDRLPGVAVVEQTTRGLIKMESSAALRQYAQSVPVLNVARSRPKMELEPPFIGRAVCASLLRRLRGRFGNGHGKRCLILGLGKIGSQVASFTGEYLDFEPGKIHVYDPDGERMRSAAEKGYSAWDRYDLKTRFHLVIGCSGRASFSVHDYVYLEDGAVLASASSGSVELSREDFIELADSSGIDDIEIIRDGLDEGDIHSDLRFRLVDREATFVNGGFPVNFDGRLNCIPAEYMQPTATMMAQAALQAVACEEKGLVELDEDFVGWIEKEFETELGDRAWMINS